MIRSIPLKLISLLSLIALPLLIGLTSINAHDGEGGETVRIIARLQADGDIEFGLRTSSGNQLPRARIFSASISDQNWMRSSPVDLANGAEVRIIARRSGETEVEFGLRIDEPPREFLPTRRFFPRSASVGRWLSSTPLLIPAPEPAEDDHTTPPPDPEEPPTPPEDEESASEPEQPEEAADVERITFGHRDGLIVEGSIVGNPDAPVLITEYGDPF